MLVRKAKVDSTIIVVFSRGKFRGQKLLDHSHTTWKE
jgi:hypothetical protein